VKGAHWWEFCKGSMLEFIQFNILAKDRQIGQTLLSANEEQVQKDLSMLE